jgi:hypothetical protein
MISAFFASATVLVFWFAAKDVVKAIYLPALIFSVGWSGLIYIGQISTPDAMATFGVMLLFAAHCRKNRAAFFICPILVMIRTDLFFVSIIYLAYTIFAYRDQWKPALLSAIITTIILYSLNKYYDYPGWSAIIYFTFAYNPADILHGTLHFSITDYFYRLARAISSIIINPQFSVFISLTLLLLAYSISYLRTPYMHNIINHKIYSLFVVSLVYVVVRFIVFPVTWERFYVPIYLWTALTLVVTVQRSQNETVVTRESPKSRDFQP